MSDIEALDAEEQWLAHPESAKLGGAGAFILYWLLKLPPDEAFDGYVSVGVSGPSPDHDPAGHIPEVVLGITGSTDTRLVNVLLGPGEARWLAKRLKKAAKQVD
jgi:hypothetical protein